MTFEKKSQYNQTQNRYRCHIGCRFENELNSGLVGLISYGAM